MSKLVYKFFYRYLIRQREDKMWADKIVSTLKFVLMQGLRKRLRFLNALNFTSLNSKFT